MPIWIQQLDVDVRRETPPASRADEHAVEKSERPDAGTWRRELALEAERAERLRVD